MSNPSANPPTTETARPAAVNVAISSSIYAPLSPSPGGLSARGLGPLGPPKAGLSGLGMVRSTSDSSAELKERQERDRRSDFNASRTPIDRDRGVTGSGSGRGVGSDSVPRRGGPAGSSSSRGPPRSSFDRNDRTSEYHRYRPAESASANATPTDASDADGGWSKVGGSRRDKREASAADAAAAAPSRSHDRFNRFRSTEGGADGGARGDDSTRPPREHRDRGDFRRERGPGGFDRDSHPRGDREPRRTSNFPRRAPGTNDHFSNEGGSEQARWGHAHAQNAEDEADTLDDASWDQPTPGCFTKSELLSLFNPDFCSSKPAHLVEVDGLNVVSEDLLLPVNQSAVSEEEAAARASGNWWGGKSGYPTKHRNASGGPVRSLSQLGGAPAGGWKGKQRDEVDDVAQGDEEDRGANELVRSDSTGSQSGKKVIRSLQALPSNDQQWRANESDDMSSPTGSKRGITSLGALPEDQSIVADAWRKDEYDQQQQQHPSLGQYSNEQEYHQQVGMQQFQQPQQSPHYPEPHRAKWYYKDPQGDTQGPFTDEEMRDWYEKGYFDLKLLVQCDIDFSRPGAEQAQFAPLGVWFINGKKAFLERIPDVVEQRAHMAQAQQQQGHPPQPQQPLHGYPDMNRLHVQEDPRAWHQQPQQPGVQPMHPPPQPQGPAFNQFGGLPNWGQGGVDPRQQAFAQQQQQQRGGVIPQPLGPQQGWPNTFGLSPFGSDPHQQQQQQQLMQQRMAQPQGHPNAAQFGLDLGLGFPPAQPGVPGVPSTHLSPEQEARMQQAMQQRVAMLQQQQEQAIAQAREAAAREAAAREEAAARANAVSAPQQPQQSPAPVQPTVTLAPWASKPAVASPTAQSMWDIQQQESRDEELRQQQAAEAEEAARVAALKAKQQAAMQSAALKAAQQERDEQAREEAARAAAAAKEAAAQAAREKKAAASAVAAAPKPVTPKPPSSFQLIQEEEERQAAERAANEGAESGEQEHGWSTAHASVNPVVSWNTSAAGASQATKKAAATKPAAKPAAAVPEPTAGMTRDQKLAYAKEKRDREAREKKEAEERAERERKEELERQKREQLERAKHLQKATWGVAPSAPSTDLRAIQAADAARAALEEQKRAEAAALQASLTQTPLSAAWTGAAKPVLSFREIQELEEAAKVESVATAAAVVGGAYQPVWGGAATRSPAPTKSPPAVAPEAVAPVAAAPAEEEEDIWGSSAKPAPAQPAVTVASKLAATFASQPKSDVASKPAVKSSKPASSPTASSGISATSPAASSAAVATPAKSSKPTENTFGGPQMSLDFENWCRTQLEKISGSSDVTLAHFLLTLESRSQIEEYIEEYLGKSSDTEKFAQGFLKFRDQAISKTAHQHNSLSSPLPASAAAAAAMADTKRKKMQKKK